MYCVASCKWRAVAPPTFWAAVSLVDCLFLSECALWPSSSITISRPVECFSSWPDYSILLLCFSLAAFDRYFDWCCTRRSVTTRRISPSRSRLQINWHLHRQHHSLPLSFRLEFIVRRHIARAKILRKSKGRHSTIFAQQLQPAVHYAQSTLVHGQTLFANSAGNLTTRRLILFLPAATAFLSRSVIHVLHVDKSMKKAIYISGTILHPNPTNSIQVYMKKNPISKNGYSVCLLLEIT